MSGQKIRFVNGKQSSETCDCPDEYGCNHYNNPPLIEKTDKYWKTPDGIRRRIRGLSQEFTYKVVNGAVKLYGQTNGVKWLHWQTVGDDRVCVICTKAAQGGRGGLYKATWFTPQMPAHFGCRCQWYIYFADELEIKDRINLNQDTTTKTTYDNFSKGKKQNIKTLNRGKVGDTDVLIINNPAKEQTDAFLDTVEKMKNHLKGVNEVKLINKTPPKITRRGYSGTVEGYHVITRNPKNFEKMEQVIVYSKGQTPEAITYTTTHEAGHLIYKKIQTEYGRTDWSDFYKKHKDEMPTTYAKEFGADEGFSESLATHLTGDTLAPAITKKLKKYGF